MSRSGGKREYGSSRSEIDGWKRTAHLVRIIAAGDRVAEAEHPHDIRSPALGRVVLEQGTCANGADACGQRRVAFAEIEGRKIRAHVVRQLAAIPRITQPQLAKRVEPPAFERTIVEACAG